MDRLMEAQRGGKCRVVPFLCLFALALCACSRKKDLLQGLRIDERFKIGLYASEPILDGPVAMAFDEKGRLYVLESPVFPPEEPDRSRIKLLEDTDGDGNPDRSGPVPSGTPIPARLLNWKAGNNVTTDPDGNIFSTSPRDHVQYRLPGLAARSISDHGARSLIYPITRNPVYPVLTEPDYSSSTCGIIFYSNARVPGFERILFTAEPVHNLVHCDRLSSSGSNFVARRECDESEFLASEDPLCRPVSFATGPEGALYVVDYYAPVACPTEILEIGVKPDIPMFRSVGKGRIYRITPRTDVRSQGPAVEGTVPDAVNRPADAVPVDHTAVNVPADRIQLERIISDPRERDTVQAAAVRALGGMPGEAAALFLLSKWRSMTTAPRSEAMEALFLNSPRLNLLLAALEDGQIPLWCLDPEHRARLLRSGDRKLADRTRRLLEAHNPSRNPAVREYEAALSKAGHKEAGELVYKRLCGRCHTYRGGSNYGPDLWTVSSRPPRQTLIDILLPSEAMAQGREMYMIDLRDGGNIDGIIGSQDATTLRILHDESRQETVIRQDVQRILLSDSSAMPVDLASQITVQDMADLLCFLTSRRVQSEGR